MRDLRPARVLEYGLAVVATGLAAVIERFLPDLPELALFPVLLLAVMASAWRGGIGPGLLAAILAAAMSQGILAGLPQDDGAAAGWHFVAADALRLGLYLLAGGAIGWLSGGRKQAEAALHANRELFHRFLDASPAAAYVKDEEGHYLYINRRMQRLFKATTPNCVGKTDFDLFSREVAQRFRSEEASVVSAGRDLTTEQIIAQEDGPHQWLAHRFCFQNASGQRFMAGIFVDITYCKSRAADGKALINPVNVGELQAVVEHAMQHVAVGQEAGEAGEAAKTE